MSGPIPGQPAFYTGGTNFDLADVGYVQEEFFLEGDAEAYSPVEPLGSDGRWNVEPRGETAPYTTRVVVHRPIDPEDFNGTVVVEWLNVSAGGDGQAAWLQLIPELYRGGYAWVGVSAQQAGLITGPESTQRKDPARYASMSHPGDSYSYDIFSQAGRALRDNADVLLGALQPERLIPVGESQSAGRLRTYINAVHPLARVYDGYMPSVGASSAPLSQSPQPTVVPPTPEHIRDDLDVPVIFVLGEAEARQMAISGNRQDDSELLRFWEVAGGAHFDHYGIVISRDDTGDRASVAKWFDSMLHPTAEPDPRFSCDVPINSGPRSFVMRAALSSLSEWTADGTPAPTADRIEIASLDPFRFAVDAQGNVRGGVRTPAVDAPVARLSGLGGSGPVFCALFGTTVPLSSEQLQHLYRNHGRFAFAWIRATHRAVRAGFLLPDDGRHITVVGARSDILR